METKQTETIGQKIDQKIKSYKELYEALNKAGNKRPASVILTEAWLNQQYVAEKIMEGLNELYEEEAKHEGKVRTDKNKNDK